MGGEHPGFKEVEMRIPKVYLAGPDVFLPSAVALGQQKREVCAAHGLEGLFPLDADLALDGLTLGRRVC